MGWDRIGQARTLLALYVTQRKVSIHGAKAPLIFSYFSSVQLANLANLRFIARGCGLGINIIYRY